MGRKLKDLSGSRYGRLTVGQFSHRRGTSYFWRCLCDCGSETIAEAQAMKRGTTASCGCLRSETVSSRMRRHGEGYGTAEYGIWQKMKSRCFNEAAGSFARYGGRGITVCDAWRDDFTAFLRDVGRRPSQGHSLDRIDNQGNYEPGNVRWATAREQARNRRNNRLVIVDGQAVPLIVAAELRGLRPATVGARVAIGWSHQAAVDTPLLIDRTAQRRK